MKRILLALLLLLPLTLAAQAQDNVGTLTVSGSGDAAGAPDLAFLRLGVQASDEDVLLAFNSSNETTAAIVDAMLALGIDRVDIRTDGLTLYQDRPYDPYSDVEDARRIYWAENTLGVTLRDVALVGRALGAGVQAGANTIDRLSFSISDSAALEARARELAFADARARAEHLAALSGMRLGQVISISEVSRDTRPAALAYRAYAMEDAGGGGAATVEEGQLNVYVEFRITWALEPQDPSS